MAFILQKKSSWHGKERYLFYLVENYREGNKIKRKTIFKMRESTDLNDYLAKIERKESGTLTYIALYEKKLNNVLDKLKMYPNFPSLVAQKKLWTQRINEIKGMLHECQQIQEKIKTFM